MARLLEPGCEICHASPPQYQGAVHRLNATGVKMRCACNDHVGIFLHHARLRHYAQLQKTPMTDEQIDEAVHHWRRLHAH